jgi:hypothetical protein
MNRPKRKKIDRENLYNIFVIRKRFAFNIRVKKQLIYPLMEFAHRIFINDPYVVLAKIIMSLVCFSYATNVQP